MMSSKPSVLESKELVQKLAEFGLSTNQAKVYLSICLLNTATVHDISEESKLYAQDIYKILPVLEKKGLIEKIIGPTITYEALPVERALINIIEAQKTQAGERFTD